MNTLDACVKDCPEDLALLHAWIDQNDQHAFEQLVERYAAMVHNTCVRLWDGDIARAEEGSQAVFIIFAQKAHSIKNKQCLGPWLHRTAINTVHTQRRMEARQQRLKQNVLVDSQLQSHADSINHIDGVHDLSVSEQAQWQEMRPLLDEGIHTLSHKIRESIILHYYNGQAIKDIAYTLATSESAIKKRLDRGRNQLRAYFARAGYSTSLIFLSTALQAESMLPCSVHVVAICFQGASTLSISAAGMLAQGVIKSMIISQIKIGAVAALIFASCAIVVAQAVEESPAQSSADAPVHVASDNNKKVSQTGQKNQNVPSVEADVDEKPKGLQAMMNVNFNNATLSAVMKEVSLLSGVKITIDPEVANAGQAPITMGLSDVSAQTVLHFAMQLTGLVAVKTDFGVRIQNKKKLVPVEAPNLTGGKGEA